MPTDTQEIPFAALLRIVYNMDEPAAELLRPFVQCDPEWAAALDLEETDLSDISFETLLSVTFEIDQRVAILLAIHAEGPEQLAVARKIFDEQTLFPLCTQCHEPIMPGDPHDECNKIIAD